MQDLFGHGVQDCYCCPDGSQKEYCHQTMEECAGPIVRRADPNASYSLQLQPFEQSTNDRHPLGDPKQTMH
jgi:hypothetical protein